MDVTQSTKKKLKKNPNNNATFQDVLPTVYQG